MNDDTLERFSAYVDENPTWGFLHVVLDDGNVQDSHVAFCREDALEHGDAEGAELAAILLGMSEAERRALPSIVYSYRAEGERG